MPRFASLDRLRVVVLLVARALHGYARLVRIVLVFDDGVKIPIPIICPVGACDAPPPIAGPAEFSLTPEQVRLLETLLEGPRSATRLKLVEPNLYKKGRGIAELMSEGMVERNAKREYQLTEFGRDYCEENSLGDDEENDDA